MKILKIGGFILPAFAQLDISQRYEDIGPEAILRTVSRRGIKQIVASKLKITTSGGGWVPSGLQTLDYAAQHEIACIAARTVPAVLATRQATLPAARRADAGHVPYGLAQLANGQTINTAVTMAGNVATCVAVSDAVHYQVGYYPKVLCWLFRPVETGPNDPTWELVAEEV